MGPNELFILSSSFMDRANWHGSLSKTKKKQVKHICMAKLKKKGKKTLTQISNNTTTQKKKTLWKHTLPKKLNQQKQTNEDHTYACY